MIGIGIDPYSGLGFSGTGGFGGIAGSGSGLQGQMIDSQSFLDNGDGFGPATLISWGADEPIGLETYGPFFGTGSEYVQTEDGDVIVVVGERFDPMHHSHNRDGTITHEIVGAPLEPLSDEHWAALSMLNRAYALGAYPEASISPAAAETELIDLLAGRSNPLLSQAEQDRLGELANAMRNGLEQKGASKEQSLAYVQQLFAQFGIDLKRVPDGAPVNTSDDPSVVTISQKMKWEVSWGGGSNQQIINWQDIQLAGGRWDDFLLNEQQLYNRYQRSDPTGGDSYLSLTEAMRHWN